MKGRYKNKARRVQQVVLKRYPSFNSARKKALTPSVNDRINAFNLF